MQVEDSILRPKHHSALAEAAEYFRSGADKVRTWQLRITLTCPNTARVQVTGWVLGL